MYNVSSGVYGIQLHIMKKKKTTNTETNIQLLFHIPKLVKALHEI